MNDVGMLDSSRLNWNCFLVFFSNLIQFCHDTNTHQLWILEVWIVVLGDRLDKLTKCSLLMEIVRFSCFLGIDFELDICVPITDLARRS